MDKTLLEAFNFLLLAPFGKFVGIKSFFFFSPKYRGKVLLGEVAEAAEEIIRENCEELDIDVIDKPFFKKESFTKETVISAKLGIRISPPPFIKQLR